MAAARPANKRNQMWTCAAIVVVTGAAAFALTRKPSQGEPPARAASDPLEISERGQEIAGIEVKRVASQTIYESVHATGQILYPAEQTVKISPRVAGRISSVFVRVGDRVSAGQTLALLESADAASAQTTMRQSDNRLRLTTLALDRAQRLLKLGTPEVTSARAALDQARAASIAAQDALLRTRRQAEIGGFAEPPLEAAQNAVIAARGALAQAQTDLAQAQRDRDRRARLVEIGVAARADLDSAENVLDKARSAAGSDQESLKLAQQALDREQKALKANLYSEQQVRASEAALRQAKLQEAAAERALALARAAVTTTFEQARGDLQAARNDAENARRALSMLGNPGIDGTVRITAPVSGIVLDRQVSPGQVVDQSQMTPWQMFVISNNDSVWVDADVFEKDIASIVPGQAASIRVNAFPALEWRGEVLRIAPSVDRTTRSIKVRVAVRNRQQMLKDGMYASVTIVPARGRQVVTLPASAVQHDADSDFVYVPLNGKFARRKVELGPQLADRYVVLHGLRPGDPVVTRGSLFLESQASRG